MAFETETLKPDVYRALEDIVGEEYISREPSVLDSYCFVWGNELLYEGDKFSPRPLAVILLRPLRIGRPLIGFCQPANGLCQFT